MKRTKIKFAIKSWKGKRKVNQDSLACGFNKQNNFCAIVCDGIGSLKDSAIASKVTTNTFIDEFVKTNKIEKPSDWFKKALLLTLKKLAKMQKENKAMKMGTTISLLMVINKKFYCFNIGDTRIYLMQKNKLTHLIKQYTYDHNYKNYLICNGVSQEKLLSNKHLWHALTKFIDPAQPNRANFELNSGTIDKKAYFLLCTDGLYACVNNNAKYEITTRSFCPLPLKLTLLFCQAKKYKTNDNVSGIIVYAK